MKHVSGSKNWTADALSRYNRASPDSSDEARVFEIESYVDEIVQPQGTDSRLQLLRKDQQSDDILTKVINFVTEGWPSYLSSEDAALKPYFERRELLTMNKEFLMLGNCLVIPASQREKVLQDLHRGHLGISKCQGRARSCVWWPSMPKDIERMVSQCRECASHANRMTEPLRPTATPGRPWQMLGTDLLLFKGETYLLVVDYYSR